MFARRRGALRHVFPKPGTDVGVMMGETRVWIEAVAPSGGAPDNPDRIPDYNFKEATDHPDTEILLRIRAAIQEKFSQ